MILPVIGVIHSDCNQRPPVSPGTAHQYPARGFGITGFHAKNSGDLPQKLIVIGIGSVAKAGRPGSNHLSKYLIFHGMGRHCSQIFRRSIILRIIQPMRIGKTGVVQFPRLRLTVHCCDEGFHRAGMMHSQCHGCIIAGVKHHAIEKLLHRAALTFLQMHR